MAESSLAAEEVVILCIMAGTEPVIAVYGLGNVLPVMRVWDIRHIFSSALIKEILGISVRG